MDDSHYNMLVYFLFIWDVVELLQTQNLVWVALKED